MTFTELIMGFRDEKPLTPYQEWCLWEIEKSKNYKIVVEGDTATIYCKEKVNESNYAENS